MNNFRQWAVACQVMLVLVSFIMSPAHAAKKPETVYTLQIASSPDLALMVSQFDALAEKLDAGDLDFLRIEKIGKYYVLRLGRFSDKSGAEALSLTIKEDLPSHIIVDAYYIEKRIEKLYGKSARSAPSPEPESTEPEKAKKVMSDIPAGTRAAFGLKGGVPELCFPCHKELKKAGADRHVHAMFKKGNCSACHNAHVSSHQGLMVDAVDTVCTGCHDDIGYLLDNAFVHGALRDSDCMTCHFPHSGERKNLLVRDEKALCIECHEDMNSRMAKPYACRPFQQGACSSCHDPHAAEEQNLLAAPAGKLCRECHEPKCRAGTTSILPLVKDSDCASCHSGHSSDAKGLLGPYGHRAFLDQKCEECHSAKISARSMPTQLQGPDLCMHCHLKNTSRYDYIAEDVHTRDRANACIFCHDHHASDQANLTKKGSAICIECHESTEKRTSAMERSLQSSRCEPVQKRQCFACHIPTHSERKLSFRVDEVALCARCHASQHKITHPVGPDVKDPRTGEILTCNSCHSMHSAADDFMLTHDRNRELCIQCHKM